MAHDDFAVEPIPGLPEELPEGEKILWQGRPSVWALAREALGIRWVAGYFVLLAIWRAAVAEELGGAAEIAIAASWMILLGGATCGLLLLTAWVQARATVYTLTNRRVVMRIGAALTLTLNLPYRQIASAGLKSGIGGTGTIALKLKGRSRVSYLVLWPHVRPWRVNPAEPALRAIPEAERVARILAEAAETRVAEPEIGRAALAAVPAE